MMRVCISESGDNQNAQNQHCNANGLPDDLFHVTRLQADYQLIMKPA